MFGPPVGPVAPMKSLGKPSASSLLSSLEALNFSDISSLML